MFAGAGGRRDPGGESGRRDAHEPGRCRDHHVDTEAAGTGDQARAASTDLAQPSDRAQGAARGSHQEGIERGRERARDE